MKCTKCSSEKLQYPEEQSAMELVKCLSCGYGFYVHNHYPEPEWLTSKHKVFMGNYSASSHMDAVKSFIKLKGILHGCEWFQLSKLEEQKLEGKLNWELGQFLDTEVERIQKLCVEQGITIEFNEVRCSSKCS